MRHSRGREHQGIVVKACILGAGHWHSDWYGSALRSFGFEITAIWDSDQERAGAKSRALGVPKYESCRDALSRGKPDVIVALPRPCEAIGVMATALDFERPIIAEKPLGMDADQVLRIHEMATSADAKINVMFPNRLSAMWDSRCVSKSDRVIAGYFRINNGGPERYVRDGCGWVLDPAQSGGGVLRNLGIHGADAIQSLVGSDEVRVVGVSMSRPALGLGAETYCVALLAAGDAIFTIDVGYNHPLSAGSDHHWRVSTESRYMVDLDETVSVSTATQEWQVASVPFGERYKEAIRFSLINFFDGGSPLASVWDCYRAARIVDAIYEAAGVQSRIDAPKGGPSGNWG